MISDYNCIVLWLFKVGSTQDLKRLVQYNFKYKQKPFNKSVRVSYLLTFICIVYKETSNLLRN